MSVCRCINRVVGSASERETTVETSYGGIPTVVTRSLEAAEATATAAPNPTNTPSTTSQTSNSRNSAVCINLPSTAFSFFMVSAIALCM